MADSTNLGKHLDDFVDGLVKTGRYESREAVVKEAVQLLERRELQKRDLDAALARGLAEAKAGLGRPLEDVVAEYEARYAAKIKQRSA
ncbi:type II toxin-antitoxin system ParD family antitoxin [Neorhizobium sp. NCHU2750]|uniref:type II toxin-antitoxin system ParD family antitoxin n=1 Tax=Neorhizobium sp. NCHU2750 TaxID=1825976 RepID=UPI000E75F35A|nr:antitoxin ParD [Neorhizobium sp. NCHU2750]